MRWRLEREERPPEARSRVAVIRTATETVRCFLECGVWRTTVNTAVARDVLVRQRGFRVVEVLGCSSEAAQPTVVRPKASAAKPGPAQPTPAQPTAAAQPVQRPERAPAPAVVQTASRPWEGERPDPPKKAAEAFHGAWEVWRADPPAGVEMPPVLAPLLTLKAPLSVAAPDPSARLPLEAGADEVSVVLAVSGWTGQEVAATERALAAVAVLGGGSHVVLVQNDPAAHAATRAWRPAASVRTRLRRRYTDNRGFSAANREGAAGARAGARWRLYTQADVAWDADAARAGIALALDVERETRGPALIGPSGGYLVPEADGWHVHEWGRNIGHPPGPPRPVDFLAGYWVLVRVTDDHGWDDGFFLYWEDVDYSLRTHLATGARPVAWTGLGVDHDRGGTIRARAFAPGPREEIRASSSARFAGRWLSGITR